MDNIFMEKSNNNHTGTFKYTSFLEPSTENTGRA
jgi:hypothetical protein